MELTGLVSQKKTVWTLNHECARCGAMTSVSARFFFGMMLRLARHIWRHRVCLDLVKEG